MKIENSAKNPIPIQANENSKKLNAQNSLEYVPKPYLEVAKKLEGEFAKLMVEQMKKTKGENEEDSSAMDYYDSLMTQEQTNAVVGREGLGVSKMILDQIYPARMRTKEQLQAFENAQEANRISRSQVVIAPQGGKHE